MLNAEYFFLGGKMDYDLCLLDEYDRIAIFKIIDALLTKKRFKDFFQKNTSTL